jgi:hypothetical protein
MNRFPLVTALVTFAAAVGSPVPTQQPHNLVPNGTFEQGDASPLRWDKLPSDGSIRWLSAGGNPGRCIVFNMSQAVAEGPGMLYYSDFFPVVDGKKYIFSVDIKSDGPVPRPFVKGYALAPDADGAIGKREFYRRQARFSATSEWRSYSMTFTPKVIPAYKERYDVQWARIMLYAYLKPGKVCFDNVSVREVAPEADEGAGREDKK